MLQDLFCLRQQHCREEEGGREGEGRWGERGKRASVQERNTSKQVPAPSASPFIIEHPYRTWAQDIQIIHTFMFIASVVFYCIHSCKERWRNGRDQTRRSQLSKAFVDVTLLHFIIDVQDNRCSGSAVDQPYCSQPHSHIHQHTAPTSLHGYQSCVLQRLNSKKGGGRERERVNE